MFFICLRKHIFPIITHYVRCEWQKTLEANTRNSQKVLFFFDCYCPAKARQKKLVIDSLYCSSPRKSLVKGERFMRGLKRNQSAVTWLKHTLHTLGRFAQWCLYSIRNTHCLVTIVWVLILRGHKRNHVHQLLTYFIILNILVINSYHLYVVYFEILHHFKVHKGVGLLRNHFSGW